MLQEEQIVEFDVTDETEAKKWLFKENIRLAQQRQELEMAQAQLAQQKKDFQMEQNMTAQRNKFETDKLEREKRLFETKWKLMEEEIRHLAEDKKQLERERQEFQAMQAEEPGFQYAMFFVGVHNRMTLKKRYRDLIKIYHPDNLAGDNETLQEINREYEHLQQVFV